MEETIRDLQSTFDTAELNADAETVDRLIADDFRSIGARGFVLDKKEWIDRHVHFEYHALETSDMDSRYQPAEEAWPVRAARTRRRTRGSRRRAGQQLGYRPGPTAAPASDACAFLRRLAAKSSRELRFASEGDLGWKGRSGCWEVRRERSNRRCCNACRTCLTTNLIGLASAGVVAARYGFARFARRAVKRS